MIRARRTLLLVVCLSLTYIGVARGREASLFIYTSLKKAGEEFKAYQNAMEDGKWVDAQVTLEKCLLNVQGTLIRRLIWEAVYYKRVAINPARAIKIWWELLSKYPENETIRTLGREAEAKLQILLGLPDVQPQVENARYMFPSLKVRREAYKLLKEALLQQIESAINEADTGLKELISKGDATPWPLVIEKHRYIVKMLKSASAGLLFCLGDLYLEKLDDKERAKVAYRRCIELYPDTEASLLAYLKLQGINGK
ncbi:tetratricopeptide repeat protein [bacterium]|nr:tetratricopeptide repeat protein [bacterium]